MNQRIEDSARITEWKKHFHMVTGSTCIYTHAYIHMYVYPINIFTICYIQLYYRDLFNFCILCSFQVVSLKNKTKPKEIKNKENY